MFQSFNETAFAVDMVAVEANEQTNKWPFFWILSTNLKMAFLYGMCIRSMYA